MIQTKKYRKPRPDFPLFPHATGRWAKKVRGKTEYFGKIQDDPKGERALQEWLDQKDFLLAGRQRRVITGALTVADLANMVFTRKVSQYRLGEIKLGTLDAWRKICALVVRQFGRNQAVEDLGADDFQRLMESELIDKAPSTRSFFISYIRSLFNFAYNDEQRLISAPVLFGTAFRKPKLARWRNPKKGEGRVFTREQIREIISSTKRAGRAMVLLGINCGFGNYDCATLSFRDLDLEARWHAHARPKTGVPRRCPLWNETVTAIGDWLAVRPKPADSSHSDLVFLTAHGLPYVRPSAKALESLRTGRFDHLDRQDSLGGNFLWTLNNLGMKRKGLSFYSLRHTFETIGGAAKDQIAVDAIMGHVTLGMGTTYRDSVDDDRLRVVTDHVHAWLFPANNSTEKKGP
jgi:integrase